VERQFDLRLAGDREELAEHLPTFDGRTFAVPPGVFVQGLSDVAHFLRNPDWLVYQWGALGHVSSGKRRITLDLERIVELGLELRDLSAYDGFLTLVSGFGNPTQFLDTLFEVRVASMFSRSNATSSLVFSPLYTVRGRRKTPEFDAHTVVGMLSVECKQRHPDSHAAAETFRRIVAAIDVAMTQVGWPDELRLEVELIGPLREQPTTFAHGLVQASMRSPLGERLDLAPSAVVHLLPRNSPFRITTMQAGHDVMVLPKGGVTGLFNPEATKLRVANNSLDSKTAAAVGAQVSNALKQLPQDHSGVIMLGGVPVRIAKQVVDRRIEDAAYDHVLAVGVVDGQDLHFFFREERRAILDRLFNSGMRPLFAAA
jgi:hypothetical protein